MGSSTVRPRVLTYLQRHPDRPVFVDDMSRELGLAARQIADAIYNSRRDNTANALDHIEVLINRNQYIWHSKPGNGTVWYGANSPRKQSDQKSSGVKSNSKRLFEEIGTSRTGTVIVQDEDGKIFRLEEI